MVRRLRSLRTSLSTSGGIQEQVLRCWSIVTILHLSSTARSTTLLLISNPDSRSKMIPSKLRRLPELSLAPKISCYEKSANTCFCMRSRNRRWFADCSNTCRTSITRRRVFRSVASNSPRDRNRAHCFRDCVLARSIESLSRHVDLQCLNDGLSDLRGGSERISRPVVMAGCNPALTDDNPSSSGLVQGSKDNWSGLTTIIECKVK